MNFMENFHHVTILLYETYYMWLINYLSVNLLIMSGQLFLSTWNMSGVWRKAILGYSIQNNNGQTMHLSYLVSLYHSLCHSYIIYVGTHSSSCSGENNDLSGVWRFRKKLICSDIFVYLSEQHQLHLLWSHKIECTCIE